MAYLYVIDACVYAKLGKTLDYKRRLSQYASEFGEDVAYEYLWECEHGSIDKIEHIAKRKFDEYEKVTSERIVADPSILADGIIEAASECKAILRPIHYTKEKTEIGRKISPAIDMETKRDIQISRALKKEKRSRKTKGGVKDQSIQIRVSSEWLEWLDESIKKSELPENRSRAIINAVSKFFESADVGGIGLSPSTIDRANKFVESRQFPTSLKTVLETAINDYIDKH